MIGLGFSKSAGQHDINQIRCRRIAAPVHQVQVTCQLQENLAAKHNTLVPDKVKRRKAGFP